MCCYAGKLLQQPAMNNPTLVVVTDHSDLDGQLFQTFSNAQELFRQTPVQANSRNNVVQEMKYGDRLKETLPKYNNRAIETAQVIKELIENGNN